MTDAICFRQIFMTSDVPRSCNNVTVTCKLILFERRNCCNIAIMLQITNIIKHRDLCTRRKTKSKIIFSGFHVGITETLQSIIHCKFRLSFQNKMPYIFIRRLQRNMTFTSSRHNLTKRPIDCMTFQPKHQQSNNSSKFTIEPNHYCLKACVLC